MVSSIEHNLYHPNMMIEIEVKKLVPFPQSLNPTQVLSFIIAFSLHFFRLPGLEIRNADDEGQRRKTVIDVEKQECVRVGEMLVEVFKKSSLAQEESKILAVSISSRIFKLRILDIPNFDWKFRF